MTPKAFGGPGIAYVKGQDPRQKLVDWMVAKENPYLRPRDSQSAMGPLHAARTGRSGRRHAGHEPADEPGAARRAGRRSARACLRLEAAHEEHHEVARLRAERRAGCRRTPPTRKNYARHYPQRLAPHVLLDAIDFATGATTKFNEFPEVKRAIQLPNEAQQNDFLDIFGRSKRDTPCVCETRIEPNLSQVLYMMFAPEIEQAVAAPEGTVARLCKDKKSTAELVAELYLRTVSRPPTPSELQDAVALVEHAPAEVRRPSRRSTRPKQSSRPPKICSGRC